MSYIDVIEYNKKLHEWTRDSDGELAYRELPTDHHLYMRDNTGKGTYKDIYGYGMRRVDFTNPWEKKKFAEDRKGVVAESDVKPAYHHIIENFIETDADSPINVSYFDIEVEFDLSEGKGYPSPDFPYGNINAFSVFDSLYDCYVMFIPHHLQGRIKVRDTREDKHVEHVWTRNERDMLAKFSEYLEHVDITTGWNSANFDWPYIMERAILHFGEKKAKAMFTRNGIPARRRDFTNEYGNDVWEWSFPGRPHLDMMLLFKKFHPGEKKSFSLDSVCEDELGEKKVAYDGDLGRLYKDDPQRFFDYSLHDSRLLKFLDDKRGIISLGMKMVRSTCSLPQDIFGSVNIINASLMKFSRKSGNIILPDMPMIEKEDFEGAIVFDTVVGRHPWVFTADISSMYPNVIKMLGASIENIVLQLEDGYDGYVAVMTKSSEVVSFTDEKTGILSRLPARDIYDDITASGWTISGNGTVFDGSMGLLAAYLDETSKEREHYKGLMKQVEYDGDAYKRYNQNQLVMKTMNNSLYGVLSQPTFRMADIRLAASTTLTGQLMGKYQAYIANKALEEEGTAQ